MILFDREKKSLFWEKKKMKDGGKERIIKGMKEFSLQTLLN